MRSLRTTTLLIAALSGLNAGCTTLASGTSAVSPVSAFAQGASAVPLHYLDFGGHGEPVILLAGAGNSAWIYQNFGKKLARDYRVFALTRRGHGGSGYPAKGYDQETLSEDLRLFMDQRKLPRAALIGHSLAGAELTNFAGKYPDRVTALVYLDAAYDRSIQAPVMDADPVTPVPPSIADRASVASFIEYVRRTRPDLVRYWAGPVQRDLQASLVIRPEGGAGWKTSGPIFGELIDGASSAAPDYSKVNAPALAIYSVEDETYRLPPGASPKQRAALMAYVNGPLAAWRQTSAAQFRTASNHKVVEMDVGHHVFLHRSEETLKLVRAFLEPLSSRSRSSR